MEMIGKNSRYIWNRVYKIFWWGECEVWKKGEEARITPWILVQQLVELDFSLTDVGETFKKIGFVGDLSLDSVQSQGLECKSEFGKLEECEWGSVAVK